MALTSSSEDAPAPTTNPSTNGSVQLPNGENYFEIRFESIGGLGAHAAGQVLGTARSWFGWVSTEPTSPRTVRKRRLSRSLLCATGPR